MKYVNTFLTFTAATLGIMFGLDLGLRYVVGDFKITKKVVCEDEDSSSEDA